MSKTSRRASALLAMAAMTGAAAATRAADLTWSTTSGTWDVGTTANWNSGTATFSNGDNVTFSNNSGGTVTIAAGGVAPTSISVSGSGTYTFKGSSISSGYLNYTGTGILAIQNLNAYTGPTTVGSTGQLQVTTLADGGLASGIGASSSDASNLVITGSTAVGTSTGLVYNGTANTTTNRLFTIGANATVKLAVGAQVTFSSSGLIQFLSPNVTTNLTLIDSSNTPPGMLVFNPEVDDNGSAKTSLFLQTGTTSIWLAGTNNQYTGPTTMFNGNFIVSKLANGGQASSIGKSSNAATNWLIQGTDTVKYVGGGDTTDRNFQITGTSLRSITLDSSGTGALVMNGAPSWSNTGNGTALSLTFTGTSAANLNNQFNGVIANPNVINQSPVVISVVKSGANTWRFGGSNTYNGDTSVTAGTLLVDGGITTTSKDTTATTSSGTTITFASGDLATGVTYGAYVSGSGIAAGTRISNVNTNNNTITLSQAISGTVNTGTSLTFTTGSGTGTGNVTVSSNATLGGSGLIYGNASLANTAVLSPGTSGAGALSFGNSLTLAGIDTKINMDFASGVRGIAYDAVNVGVGNGGAIVYDGDMTLTINSAVSNGTFNLFAFDSEIGDLTSITLAGSGGYSGAFTNVGSGVWTASSAGTGFEFDEQSGNLIVTVPEPSTAILSLGLLIPLMRRRRRTVPVTSRGLRSIAPV